MSKYADIIARLEAATGPDRELDVLTGCAIDFEIEDMKLRERVERSGVEDMVERANRHQNIWSNLPHYTASLDAAIGLVERMLPNSLYRLEKHSLEISTIENRQQYWATCGAPGAQEEAYAASQPVALLIAMFRALEAQEVQP